MTPYKPRPPLLYRGLHPHGRRLFSPAIQLWAVGLAALAIAGFLHLYTESRWVQETAGLNSTLVRQRRLSMAVQQVAPPKDSQGEFLAALPASATREVRLVALLQLFQTKGLNARLIEFRMQPEPAMGLQRFSVSMTLEGSYAMLRETIDEALVADPAMALLNLRLQRQNPQSESIKAYLDWAILMRIDAPIGKPPTGAKAPVHADGVQ